MREKSDFGKHMSNHLYYYSWPSPHWRTRKFAEVLDQYVMACKECILKLTPQGGSAKTLLGVLVIEGGFGAEKVGSAR